jgi:A/G-specific adenine glycosylase
MASFVSSLLEWAKTNIRSFPWRKTNDPYKILIAEIMLQRTKAEQVLPIYESFVEKYPDLSSLSRASESEIREEITSLGLAKRAQGLNKLVKQLLEEYSGQIPNSKDKLLNLHWVGNYIANAILCHAFGEDVPTVDANFSRVLVRVFSLKAKPPVQKDKQVWSLAEKLMPLAKGYGRTFNLAILDLASGICTPKKPFCETCPLNAICDYGIAKLKNKLIS